jgi:hypothetical protein
MHNRPFQTGDTATCAFKNIEWGDLPDKEEAYRKQDLPETAVAIVGYVEGMEPNDLMFKAGTMLMNEYGWKIMKADIHMINSGPPPTR